MDITHIAQAIKTTELDKRPILISIDGFGGSGKTTLASKLQSALGNAYVINIDDFIVKEKLAEPSWDSGVFDRRRLERQVLLPATRGEVITYQKLVWQSNILSGPVTIPPVDYLVVEGITASHPDIAHYYDYKIWVDTPLQVAKARGKARDADNENVATWDMWAENDIAYQRAYHPERTAEFVVPNG